MKEKDDDTYLNNVGAGMKESTCWVKCWSYDSSCVL